MGADDLLSFCVLTIGTSARGRYPVLRWWSTIYRCSVIYKNYGGTKRADLGGLPPHLQLGWHHGRMTVPIQPSYLEVHHRGEMEKIQPSSLALEMRSSCMVCLRTGWMKVGAMPHEDIKHLVLFHMHLTLSVVTQTGIHTW